MKTKLVLLAVFCAALGGCVGNRATPSLPGIRQNTATRATLQNKPLQLNVASSLNPDCSVNGMPVVQVIEPPANGSATVGRVLDYTNYSQANQRSACNKKKSPGTELVYRPNQEFVGTDTLVADTISPAGEIIRIRYNIEVR